jgi:hypothetical protein
MAYFPDLVPYSYGYRLHPGVVHVGWLDRVHPCTKGSVDAGLIEKMKLLLAKPVEISRGYHICDLCAEPPNLVKTTLPNRFVLDQACSWAQWAAQRWGNGEIRVSSGGVTFAAPVLIVHYVEEHGYLPPVQFLKAVDEG